MTIRELCHQAVVSIDQGAALADAARLMRKHHVGALTVTAEDGAAPQVIGFVTDRDIALEGFAREDEPAVQRVGQIAQRELVAVPADADVAQAVQTMQRHGVRRLLAVEPDGRLLGVISLDDVIEALALQLHGLAGALRHGIERESERRGDPVRQAPGTVFLPLGTPGMH